MPCSSWYIDACTYVRAYIYMNPYKHTLTHPYIHIHTHTHTCIQERYEAQQAKWRVRKKELEEDRKKHMIKCMESVLKVIAISYRVSEATAMSMCLFVHGLESVRIVACGASDRLVLACAVCVCAIVA